MFDLLWPILIVVAANTTYNICTKSTPAGINSFASLSITYFIASLISIGLYFFTSPQKNLFSELSKANWTSLVLGISIVALEFGYINMYRAGWKVSAGSLVANISLACVLLFVGLLFYKESISLRQIIGIIFCIVGLFLIGR